MRVRGISIKTGEAAQAPKLIKIVSNNPNIGFEDVQDAVEPQVSQIFELDEETVTTGKMVSLRFVKFQSVQSIHVTCFNFTRVRILMYAFVPDFCLLKPG